MKQPIKNNKAILLTQTGLALIFFLAGIGSAAAQSAPAVSIDAPIPGSPVSAPAPAATPASTTRAAPVSVTAPMAAQAAATPSATAPVVQGTLPPASKAEAASQPSAAELAVIHNPEPQGPGTAAPEASATNTTPGAPAKAEETVASKKKHGAHKAKENEKNESSAAGQENGLKVTDILATPANVRPLPQQYLIVKKEHNANDMDARLTSARSALAQGDYQAALQIFDDLYRKNPRDMRIIMGRAVALQKLGQTDEAMDAYQVALRTDPHNIEAITNVLGLLRGKDTQTALQKLQQLRDLYPANADVTAQLGMVYGVAGDYTNAIKYLNMADALKPGNPTVLYNKAVAYDHMGNTTEAANLYRQILLLASDGDLDKSFPLEVVRQRLAALR